MRTKLFEVFQIDLERGGVLDLPKKFWPEPGQYLPCQRMGEDDFENIVPQLFQVLGEVGRLSVSPLPAGWQPGDHLFVDSPQGHGFRLPSEARRVALLPHGVSPGRLLPLVTKALTAGASISLFCDSIPSVEIMARLPASVEVNPLSALLDDLDWPDFLAGDVEIENLSDFTALFAVNEINFEGQVLVRTAMPCRGLGECGVCSLRTTRGSQLACVDGPVFRLKELLNVAQ